MALVPEKKRRVKRPILGTPATKVSARRKRGVGVVLSIIKSSASAESLTAQQRGELQAAKRRVEAALAKPGLSADALRARAVGREMGVQARSTDGICRPDPVSVLVLPETPVSPRGFFYG